MPCKTLHLEDAAAAQPVQGSLSSPRRQPLRQKTMAARLALAYVAARTASALKPLASPVVIGGTNGAVTAALYGKLQRMESSSTPA